MGVGSVSGADGVLRWGYYAAGTVRDWTMTRTDAGWALQASIFDADTFRLSQRPIVFHVQRAGCRWPVIELQMMDGTLTASLGPKESLDAVPLRQT